MSNKGKIAVITGGGGTLCGPVALDLAKQGCRIVLIGRRLEVLEKRASEVRALGAECLCISADVKDEARMLEVHEEILSRLGKVSILVNGAGGNQMDVVANVNEYTPGELEPGHDFRGWFDLKMDRFLDVVNVNLMGTVIPSHIFSRDMVELGGGSIVNFASMNTYRPLSRVPAYAAAKAAVSNFTQWLAAYLAPAGIRVNAVAPGFFWNERSPKLMLKEDGTPSERAEHILYHTPMHRWGQAGELLGCIHWLLDDDQAGFVTGITVPVDGGFLSNAGL
ncbi:MAG: SDR family NAD(P)-dependent oxidoreductase [Bacteroidales bacterium]|nr:SDR family NAD(P)-dependent oxidoreductase [Bacteroidales bacterium]